jgi:hypothetical protein
MAAFERRSALQQTTSQTTTILPTPINPTPSTLIDRDFVLAAKQQAYRISPAEGKQIYVKTNQQQQQQQQPVEEEAEEEEADELDEESDQVGFKAIYILSPFLSQFTSQSNRCQTDPRTSQNMLYVDCNAIGLFELFQNGSHDHDDHEVESGASDNEVAPATTPASTPKASSQPTSAKTTPAAAGSPAAASQLKKKKKNQAQLASRPASISDLISTKTSKKGSK